MSVPPPMAPVIAPGERRCPACGVNASGSVTDSGFCRACGHDYVRSVRRGIKSNLDLRAVARHQRWVIIVAALTLLSYLLYCGAEYGVPLGSGAAGRAGMQVMTVLPSALRVLLLIISIVGAVTVGTLAVSLRMNIISVVLHIILALVPCLGVLSLLSVSSQASIALRLVGLRVGLLGVADEKVVRILSSNRCRSCGYILATGAQRCPECGAAPDFGG